jgi:hypothetical protein
MSGCAEQQLLQTWKLQPAAGVAVDKLLLSVELSQCFSYWSTISVRGVRTHVHQVLAFRNGRQLVYESWLSHRILVAEGVDITCILNIFKALDDFILAVTCHVSGGLFVLQKQVLTACRAVQLKYS